MDRREFSSRIIGAMCAGSGIPELLRAAPAASVPSQAGSSRLLRSSALPREVAGLRIPDSGIATTAVEIAREACEASLFNHCARTYVFAGLLGVRRKLKVDLELLFLASILHDLGLTERYMGPARFEVQGADAARSLLTAHGVSSDRASTVHDAILMHATGFIAETRQPEIALVSIATGTDVVGDRLDQFSSQETTQIDTAFPRLGFKKAFVKTCAAVVARYPGSAHGFMRDIGARKVPHFRQTNICDAIDAAPFAE